jgi:CelD/BcsL family acetyltransferase involved in cellulose biosynthesis
MVDPITDSRWSELVASAPDGGVFHDPRWLGLVRDTYRYPMHAVCLEDRAGQLVAGLPIATVSSRFTGTRLVSLPFSDLCPPLARDPGHHAALMAALDAERRQAGLPLEIHAPVPELPGGAPSERFYHHVVPLEGGLDAVLGRMASSKRRAAAKARKQGATVTARTDRPALQAFFRLHVLTRRKLGVPTQPRRFFTGLEALFADGLGFALLVEWDGRPIGAGVYLRHGTTLTYKYGASDPAQLDKRPNDLMMHEALRIGCERGCTALDLGRSEEDNDGLRRFKRGLGGIERELSYTMAPPRAQRSVRSVSGRQQAVIRRAPPWFGRALGAAVYRHFG